MLDSEKGWEDNKPQKDDGEWEVVVSERSLSRDDTWSEAWLTIGARSHETICGRTFQTEERAKAEAWGGNETST